MAFVDIVGSSPLWVPFPKMIYGGTSQWGANDAATLDADEEEYQVIASVTIDGGGSKTFGTSGSKIDWIPGASITFGAGSTLRVGVKDSSKIDLTAGPVGRATPGAAAFNVYTDLVGGTDTITSTTWRSDSMASGTGFTVNDGDQIVIAFHLDVSSGSPSVKVRAASNQDATNNVYPVHVLITSNATVFSALALTGNFILTFDDGTIGWLEPSHITLANDSQTSAIGNGNVNANILNLNFDCKIDALAAVVNPTTNAANYNLELYSSPLGTPALVESLSQDANVGTVSVNNIRMVMRRLTQKRTLNRNTDYAIGVKQTTGTSVTLYQGDVNTASHFKANSLGPETYAAISTSGGAFSQQASGLRRYGIFARICSLADSSTGGSTRGYIIGG